MNCENWSNREVRLFYYLSMALYFAFTILAPAGIIMWKYKLFHKGGGNEISGGAIILIIAVSVIAYRKVKKVIVDYKAETIKEKRFKYSALMLFALLMPALALVVMWAMKDNFKLAFTCARYIVGFYLVAIVLDYCVFKYLEDERNLRKESQHKAEINKREKYTV